jgi:hypothetical protein
MEEQDLNRKGVESETGESSSSEEDPSSSEMTNMPTNKNETKDEEHGMEIQQAGSGNLIIRIR